MLVKDMDDKDFIDLCRARQEWGTKKYGDADKHRDCCRDLTEEIVDVVNIVNRRKQWIYRMIESGELEISDQILDNIEKHIEVIIHDMYIAFEDIKALDVEMKRSEYPEPDDVERIWFGDR